MPSGRSGAAAGRLALVAAVVWAALAAMVAAQTPGGGLLTLNPEALFSDSRYGQRIVADLEARSADLQAENRRIEAELTAEERDLTTRRPGLAIADFRGMAEAFDQKVERTRADQDGKIRALQERRDEERRRFFARIGPILSDILRESDAAALVDRRSLILAADRIDITALAIARIDAALGDGGQTEGAPPPAGAPARPVAEDAPDPAPGPAGAAPGSLVTPAPD